MRREQRKLAAILAADVVGYSRLMGRDEAGTLARLREHRVARLEPALSRNGGRLVKLLGDGALAEFASAVDAVRAAIEFQQAMSEVNVDQPDETRIAFRVGLHLGDLIVDGDDLYGDGVNVAARLEGQATPGGIVASVAVHDAVAGRLQANFHDLGTVSLKNIERPIRAYAVTGGDALSASATPMVSAAYAPTLSLPDKPSIAVLPFQNMSGDPEQEYFADGVVEDIITALSRFKSLFVIARNSSFTYKGRAVDIKQVGRELGVRYVLEGSVRRSGERLRITGQLIESETGAHIWADRFDGLVEDVFDLQDKVTASVTGQLPLYVEGAEIGRIRRRDTLSLGAYESHLQGLKAMYQSTRDSLAQSLKSFYRSIELDPDFVLPHAWASAAYAVRKQNSWMEAPEDECAEAIRLARKAVDLGPDDHRALGCAGLAMAYIAGDVASGLSFLDQALLLNENDAALWHASGWIRFYNGEHDVAVEHFERAERLSPRDPQMDVFLQGKASAHFCGGRYEEALSLCKRLAQRHPERPAVLAALARTYAKMGEIEEARIVTAQLLKVNPGFRMSLMSSASIMRRTEDRDLLQHSARLAGLPE